ncbi:MAG: hypothetical protein AAGA66_01030, partial [Bacteroidota bacterium]
MKNTDVKTKDAKGSIKEFFIEHVWTYRTFLLIIIIGAMVNNLEHSADLYMKISSKVSTAQAYSVVIIFDLIVIALIGVGDSKALIFAVSVFFINELAWDGINVFYQIYKKSGDIDYTPDKFTVEYLSLIEKGVVMLIYGGTFAFTVHYFSCLFKIQTAKRSKLSRIVAELRNRLAERSATNIDLSSRLAEDEKRLAELELIAKESEQKASEKGQLVHSLEQHTTNLTAEVEE